jgi:FkbH-like protein
VRGDDLQLREEIDHLIAVGDALGASLRLTELWQQETGAAVASFLIPRYEKLRGARPFIPHRLAILRSFTLEPVVPLLRAAAFVAGVDLTVHLGGFNTYPQEILDTASPLYSFAPDTVILAVQTRDVARELWSDYADLAADAVQPAIARSVASFQSCVRTFRQQSVANLIVHALEQPPIPSLGVLDAQTDGGQSAAIRQINDGLRGFCQELRGVYMLDYDSLVARHGYAHWHDESKWLTARMPISASYIMHLAQEWLRFLLPLAGRTAKAVVVDLDNTLWGGVIGEDGMHGIRLGQEYPGAAYQALQRALLDLRRKGILLAVCSKNNLEDAMEVLEKHPDMLLKPEHFAAMRINWSDKTQNLREIAAELNIGIDAIAFLDDNPVERAQVRVDLPEMTVIELPADPSKYADAVRDSPVFERLTLSEEDRRRASFYASGRERANAEQSFESKEDFLRSLEQEAEVVTVGPATLARVAQLTQKTNQFNLTTRRYSEQQISELAKRPGWQVVSLRLRDRYGDHGLVGVAIVQFGAESCEIDTFLLSCRVIGRSVETALLSHLVETARTRGAQFMRGWFFSTRKNAPAKNFYAQHGFQQESSDSEGSPWTLDLQKAEIACPEWIKVRVLAGAKF